MSWAAGTPDDAAVRGLPAGRPASSARRAASVLGLLGRFGLVSGWPASAECLLDYDLIEGFCVRGCAGAASSTRGTYRSVLYALAGPVNGRPGSGRRRSRARGRRRRTRRPSGRSWPRSRVPSVMP